MTVSCSCSGRHEEENREPAQLPLRARSPPPPVQEAAEPLDPTDRPKLTLAPRSKADETEPEQPAAAPVKKVQHC